MTELPDATKTRRSGRDMPMAVAVGVGILVVVGGSLFVREEVFVAFAILAVGAALWELGEAFKRRNIKLPLLPLWVGTAGILISAYVSGLEALMVSFILTVAGIVVWRALDGRGVAALRDAFAGVFAAAYLPFMAEVGS